MTRQVSGLFPEDASTSMSTASPTRPRVLDALHARFRARMAGEKRRYFTREEFDALTPGMFDYLCDLRKEGMAEFHEDESGLYFMARVYEAERL